MDNATISRPDLRRRAEAGHWLLKLQEDPLSEAQVEAWLKWSADAENLAEFEAQQTLYTSLLGNRALRHVGPSIHARSSRVAAKRRIEGERSLLGTSSSRHPASLKGLATHMRGQWHRRRVLAAAASVMLTVGTGFLAWTWAPTFSISVQTYSTGKAIHREVALPDGSQAVLGADSKLTVAYDGRRRHVTVEQGEAYFEVRKDSRRPFVVESGGLSVTAVGTAFDVRRNDGRVVVTVAEGSVDIERETPTLQKLVAALQETQPVGEVRARSGERVTLDSALPAMTVSSVHPSAAGNWRHGSLEFAGEPLQVVVANLNRYLSSEVVIRDAEAGQWVYSGTVQPAYVDEWLNALVEVFPLRVVHEDGRRVLVRTERRPRLGS